MILLRVEDGQEPLIFPLESAVTVVKNDAAKTVLVHHLPRAWRYTPHLGYYFSENPKLKSSLCGKGYAAIGLNKDDALRLINQRRRAVSVPANLSRSG